MESNWTATGNHLAIISFSLFIFGIFYNWLIGKFPRITARYTALVVTLGVVVTVIGSGFVIGWENAFNLTILFIASGAPMIIGAELRNYNDEQEAIHELERLSGINQRKPNE